MQLQQGIKLGCVVERWTNAHLDSVAVFPYVHG